MKREPLKRNVWKRAPNPNSVREKNRLLPEEEAGLRKAMEALRIRFGNWCAVARALKTDRTTVGRVMLYRRRATPAFAIRVARLVGVAASDVLSGRFPALGQCPMCGKRGRKVHTKGAA